MTVIRVRTDHEWGRRQERISSNTTGKPRPPMITAALMGRSTEALDAKPIRLSANSEKPALLKADTAWKTPCATASL